MNSKVVFSAGTLTGMVLMMALLFAARTYRQQRAAARMEARAKAVQKAEDRVPAVPLEAGMFERNFGGIDYNWALQRPGQPVEDFEDYKGKVLFVNMWATWCGPCITEMPSIENLKNRFEDEEDLAFLLVTDESLGIVEEFINTQGYDFAQTLPLYSSQKRRPVLFIGSGYPTTYIVDRAGYIRYKETGMANWDDDTIEQYLQALLEETQKAPTFH